MGGFKEVEKIIGTERSKNEGLSEETERDKFLEEESIKRSDKQTVVNIYPNPSDGKISIVGKTIIRKLLVYNQLGQLKQQFLNVDQTTFDLSLPSEPGLYILKIVDQQGGVYQEKVVRQ